MAQVSKRYLSPEVQGRMYEILVNAVSKSGNKDDVVCFLTDLFSPTERIMLAKRLAIAYLLIKDKHTHREISKILRVSVTTIQKISLVLKIEGKGYRKITNSMIRDERVEEFMGKVAEVLTAIPPKGKDWSRWRKEREVRKRVRIKAF